MQQLEMTTFASGPRARLFFALVPDDATREAMGDAVGGLVAIDAPRGRRSDPRRYHVTLQYLGEFQPVPSSLVAAASAAAADTASVLRPFELTMDRAGSFGGGDRWLWWLGFDDTSPALQRLYDELGLALGRRGVKLPPNPPFRPHATVLRNAERPPSSPLIAPLRWKADSFALISSAAEGPPAYIPLGVWSLGATQ